MDFHSPFVRLTERLEYFEHRAHSFRRSDLDCLILLADLSNETVSKRFQDVLISFDKGFAMMEDSTKIEYVQRLVEINKITVEFPKKDLDGTLSDELIPSFQLPISDKSRVLALCQEMRKIIFSADHFDEPHKRRLLNRIAAIEQQVHQKRGYFDIVRGGINDLGETLNKFGKDIEPLTKRMQEVVQIARKATKEYDQLPPPEEVKKLPPPDNVE